MKQYILVSVLIVLTALSPAICPQTEAQEPLGYCGMENIEVVVKRLKENKHAVANGILDNRSGSEYYAPLKFHMLARNDGSSRIQELDIFEQVCQLNNMYQGFSMQFYIRDDGFQYLNNTEAFEDPSGNNGYLAIFRGNKSINLYLTLNATSGRRSRCYPGVLRPP